MLQVQPFLENSLQVEDSPPGVYPDYTTLATQDYHDEPYFRT